jgi:cytochrome c-type biogenesis protein
MAFELSIPAALIAGLFSFLSPCVLPLVSSWLVFLSGGEAAGQSGRGGLQALPGDFAPSPPRRRLVLATLSFTLGFSVVFILLSLLFSGLFMLLGPVNRLINIAAGIIILVFGLNIIFNFIPLLNYERRARLDTKPRTFLGAFVVGLAFGAGWTPCIGPILGSILLMAGQRGEFLFSAVCLAAYSAGLALPFLAAAFFWGGLLKHLGRLRALTPAIQRISGGFIAAVGVLVMLGRFKNLSGFFLRAGYALASPATEGARFIPAAVFFALALLPLPARLLRKKPPSRGFLVFSGLFAVLALLQAAGVFSLTEILSRWFLYVGL